MGIPGEPLFAIVTPSEHGGWFRWKCLTPETSRILLKDHEWVFVVCDSPAFQPVLEVTYRRWFRKATAYYSPDVIDLHMVKAGSWRPDTPEEKAERARLKEIQKEHLALMRSPEGIEELRKAIRIIYLDSKDPPHPTQRDPLGQAFRFVK